MAHGSCLSLKQLFHIQLLLLLDIMHHILPCSSCVLAVSHVACFHVNVANWHLHVFSTTEYMYICATSCGVSLLYKDHLVSVVHVHENMHMLQMFYNTS